MLLQTLLAAGSSAFLGFIPPEALAAPVTAVEPISPFALSEFGPVEGWTELPSGLLYHVEREGRGDAEKVRFHGEVKMFDV
jgi:hypothetical protein